MKKIFTLIAVALLGGGNLFAQDVVDLSAQTYDAERSSNDVWYFTGTDITIVPTGGRAAGPKDFPDKASTGEDAIYQGLNIKNNGEEVIKLPDGVKLYRIEIFGWSQGDNFEYIYAYGVGDKEGGYEWVEPKGKLSGAANNGEMASCKYPLDPCAWKGTRVPESTKEIGYCVAALDFGDDPYEGEFPITVTGNNQADMNYRLYLSREAAIASTRNTGDAPSGKKDEPGWVSIDTAIKALAAENTNDAAIYNIAGQKVDASYKGLVIKNGKKYIVK